MGTHLFYLLLLLLINFGTIVSKGNVSRIMYARNRHLFSFLLLFLQKKHTLVKNNVKHKESRKGDTYLFLGSLLSFSLFLSLAL